MTQHDVDRYLAAAHAMQSGVAIEQQLGSDDGNPKHLWVGVNSAQVGITALVGLLAAKGVLTLDEYEAVLADEMEAEVARYAQRLTEHYDRSVRLA